MENTAIDIKVAHLTGHDRMGKKPSHATVPLKHTNFIRTLLAPFLVDLPWASKTVRLLPLTLENPKEALLDMVLL